MVGKIRGWECGMTYYVPLTTTVVVATGMPVPFAKALEAKSVRRRRERARLVRIEVDRAILFC